MKHTLLLLFLLPTIAFGQEVEQKFVYDKIGLNPKFVVVDIAGKTNDELFKNAINWIKETYVDPDEVIKATIDNEKVRIRAYRDDLFCYNSLGSIVCNGAYYTIEIAFKDNKYKFTPFNIDQRLGDGRMQPLNFEDGTGYYNKKGNIKPIYKSIPSSIGGLFNGLNSELSKYLLQTNEKADDDW